MERINKINFLLDLGFIGKIDKNRYILEIRNSNGVAILSNDLTRLCDLFKIEKIWVEESGWMNFELIDKIQIGD